jgi:hypothetical protein
MKIYEELVGSKQRTMRKLYHGTLTRNIEEIREHGLQPRSGLLTTAYHEDPAKFVCAADENHKGGLTRILIQKMVNARLIRRAKDYSLERLKQDLLEHVTILVVNADNFTYCTDMSNCPKGVETGDWYSCNPVPIQYEMTGETMLEWLPLSEINFNADYYRFLTD